MTDSQESLSEAPRRSASRTIARNTLFGIGAQFALKFINVIFNVLIVRSLGGADFGQYQIVLAWTGLFSVIGDLGVTQYLQREIARDKAKTEELFWDTVSLRLILAVICSAITVLAANLLTDYSEAMIVGVFITTLGYLFQAFMVPLGSILTGHERVDIMSVFGVAQQVIFMSMVAVVLLLNLGYVGLLTVGTLTLPLMLGLYIWSVRRNKLSTPRFKIHPNTWWTILLRGIPFGFQQLSLTFAFRADTVLLRQFNVPDLFTGWYSIAYTSLTLVLLSFVTSFNNAVMPTLAREHAQNPDVIRNWYFRSVKMLLFIGLPLAVGGTVLAWQIVGFLFPKELPAALPFTILIWDVPFVMYHSFCGIISTSIQREGAGARIYGSLGILNISLNLILIPQFGIIGSSFATVITDVLGAVLFYLLYRKEFGPGLGFTRLARIGLSAAAMGIVALLLRDMSILISIPVSGLVYLMLVFLTGAFTDEEKSDLYRIVQRLQNAIASRLRPQAA